MGGHYGSIQIRSENRQLVTAVAERVAKAKHIHILVAPPVNGWIALFPDGNGQDDAVGHAVAEQLDEDVLQLIVHDDDILAYWYYRARGLIDSYWSCPGYFGEENRQKEEAMSGDAQHFKHLVGEGDLPKLAELLKRDSDFTFEHERLSELGKLLKISNAVNAYEYLKSGECNGIENLDLFVEVPADRVKNQAKQRKQKNNRLAAEREQLKMDGLLIRDDERQDVRPFGCAAGDGFLVAWPDYSSRNVSFDWYSDLWKTPTPLSLGMANYLAAIASNASAHRIAFAAGHCVSAWEHSAGKWLHVCDVPEEDVALAVAFSPDGNLLAHASGREIVVSQIDPRQAILRYPTDRSPGALAFHPSKEWLAVSGNSLGLLALHESKPWREIYVGGEADPSTLEEATLGREMALSVGFSRDGRWLWCGTQIGARVYDWESVPRSNGSDMPKPKWSFDPHPDPSSLFGPLVGAIAEDVEGNAIVFGGSGRLYHLGLATGDVKELILMPQHAAITGLAFSKDNRALGMTTHTVELIQPAARLDQTFGWSIWSYEKLLENAR